MAISKIPTCYASCSIGTKPEHDLPAKLKAISSAGFDAIELSMPDLLSFANSHLKKDVSNYDYPELCEAGREVKELCKENNLKILMLQPFANFEGWPDKSPEREDAWKRAKGWMQIMEAVGTDMLQVRYLMIENLSAEGRCHHAKPARANGSHHFRSARQIHQTLNRHRQNLPTILHS